MGRQMNTFYTVSKVKSVTFIWPGSVRNFAICSQDNFESLALSSISCVLVFLTPSPIPCVPPWPLNSRCVGKSKSPLRFPLLSHLQESETREGEARKVYFSSAKQRCLARLLMQDHQINVWSGEKSQLREVCSGLPDVGKKLVHNSEVNTIHHKVRILEGRKPDSQRDERGIIDVITRHPEVY